MLDCVPHIYFYVITEREGRDLPPLCDEDYYVVNSLEDVDSFAASDQVPAGEYDVHSIDLSLGEIANEVYEVRFVLSFTIPKEAS